VNEREIMSETNFVGAGIGAPDDTVGLTGLVPFAIVHAPETRLRPADGILRVHLQLAPGNAPREGVPIRYRVYGGEAGLEFPRNGQIVVARDVVWPLVLTYTRRFYPEPPVKSQLVLDLAFQHQGGFQDVQWRLPITWDPSGATQIDLQFVQE
jgi:hypothetical protein